MVQLEIKSWNSPDIELNSRVPGTLDEICFLLEIEIGEVGDRKCDLFYLVVATPEGLRQMRKPVGNVLADRATLVISELNWVELRTTVIQLVKSCAAATWNETVLKLQRYFQWEYEDYSENK